MADNLFRGVQVEDRGLDPATAQMFVEVQAQLRRSFKEAEARWTSIERITVNVGGTQTDLNNALDRGLIRIGMVIWMYISWGEARQLAAFGLVPSDGSNGTVPLIPPQNNPDDIPQRFLRAVDHGNDPWTVSRGNARTGGAATHTHNDHDVGGALANHTNGDIGDHTINAHDMTDTNTLNAHPTTTAAAGSDFEALNDCAGTNHGGSATHGGDLSHDDLTHNGTVSHVAATHLPPFAEAIPMMKVR